MICGGGRHDAPEIVCHGAFAEAADADTYGERVTRLDDPVELVDEIRDGRCEAVDELTTLRR